LIFSFSKKYSTAPIGPQWCPGGRIAQNAVRHVFFIIAFTAEITTPAPLLAALKLSLEIIVSLSILPI